MFCSQCGQPVDPEGRFCPHCGGRVEPPSYQPAAPEAPPQAILQAAPQTGGAAVFVFKANRKFSMFKLIPCHVVFYYDRAVLAHMTPALQKARSAEVSQEIKADGLGFFKGSAAMMRYWAEYHQRYYTMPMEAILAEDPSNMVLYYQNVSEVYFKGYSQMTDYENSNTTTTQGKLHFTYGGETIHFSHDQPGSKSIKDTLTKLFGARLKFRR